MEREFKVVGVLLRGELVILVLQPLRVQRAIMPETDEEKVQNLAMGEQAVQLLARRDDEIAFFRTDFGDHAAAMNDLVPLAPSRLFGFGETGIRTGTLTKFGGRPGGFGFRFGRSVAEFAVARVAGPLLVMFGDGRRRRVDDGHARFSARVQKRNDALARDPGAAFFVTLVVM